MKMLDEQTSSQADDIPVTLADQENINRFSRLNNRIDDIIGLLEGVRKGLEDLREVEGELELKEMEEMGLDEEEEEEEDDDLGGEEEGKTRRQGGTSNLIMYKQDSTFVHLPPSQVLELVQRDLARLEDKERALQGEREECETGMEKLKTVLYAKFGTNINLERGD